jgi:plasmid replication initiation protein
VVEKLTDLFEQARAAQAKDPPQKLAPDRHPNRDFFVADVLEWALKGDRHSMEHPMFSLSKKPDHKSRRYEHNGNTITIEPGKHGLATIWDRDILIYAISQLVAAMNQDRPVSRKVRLKAYDLLVATNRHTGGKNYQRLIDAFRRLAGTRVETNIATNGQRIREGFGLLDNWKIIERAEDGQMLAVEIVLNEWLFNAVLGREVLTLNRDYFQLDGGLDRRLYEIARKHCGQQPQWSISTTLLRTKSGSTASLKRFRQQIKAAAGDNALPDYRLTYQTDTDQVTFERRPALSVH